MSYDLLCSYCPSDAHSVYGQSDVGGHCCGLHGYYSVYDGWCYHVAYGYWENLSACDHADYSTCNWDDHCVDYVLMGSAALIAQQGR